MASTKVQRIMTQPINLIFRFLQSVRTPALFGFLSRALAAGRPGPALITCPRLVLCSLEQKARIQIWLFEQKDLRIEGRIIASPLTT